LVGLVNRPTDPRCRCPGVVACFTVHFATYYKVVNGTAGDAG
jgi:hypothetical protein